MPCMVLHTVIVFHRAQRKHCSHAHFVLHLQYFPVAAVLHLQNEGPGSACTFTCMHPRTTGRRLHKGKRRNNTRAAAQFHPFPFHHNCHPYSVLQPTGQFRYCTEQVNRESKT